MKIYIIGGQSRLAISLANKYEKDSLVLLNRSLYSEWSKPGAKDLVSRFFEKCSDKGSIIFVTSGLLDPNLNYEDLLRINYHLPKNIIDGVRHLGMRVVTFGTILERSLQPKNNYVASKSALSSYISSLDATCQTTNHFQLHTLFGLGQPNRFMFLGQILSALKKNRPFFMISGRQLREYHHYDDEAEAIKLTVKSPLSSIITLSHGNPIDLNSIANSIFDAFGKRELLHSIEEVEPDNSIYEKSFPKNTVIKNEFRDPLTSIVSHMKEAYRHAK